MKKKERKKRKESKSEREKLETKSFRVRIIFGIGNLAPLLRISWGVSRGAGVD